ncbi:TetR/AcrR family transcriptional regulator [Pseudolactococcus reticulitermitis]|uniref:HTH tetR-type domain-containing protein n=1 Tax=Pseudolactococcus reticulitermitis TaxID=2025039 RepID=A0A224X0J6_9LACT|nr:TetR/AcrR family transcriptional regulator [Lactococcus reticulitermitis]GAX47747.1 hypothetical protein RsY01_1348 [Lactococcus reticulitermitis]
MVIISETQLRIIDSFFLIAEENGTVQKITMQQIAERAGIRRQNIYKNHFNGIEDIIQTVHLLIARDCKQKMSTFIASHDQDMLLFIAKEILPILYAKRRWLKNLYNPSLDPDWVPFLYQQYLPLVQVYFENRLDHVCAELGITSEFLYHLIIGNILTIISCWLTSDKPEPPSIFQKKFLKLAAQSLNHLLNFEASDVD